MNVLFNVKNILYQSMNIHKIIVYAIPIKICLPTFRPVKEENKENNPLKYFINTKKRFVI